jgi:sulfur-oxidizing protein SoxY
MHSAFSFQGPQTMRLSRTALSVGIALGCILVSSPAFAGTAWDDIRASVFGNKAIVDGRELIKLSAPGRPEDMRVVPIGVDVALGDRRTIKTITVLIDENPTPVVAVFHIGKARDTAKITSHFRVDRQSDVRVVVEASDGQLYMVSQLIKFAGGQSSCSAPPMGDPVEIAASMGQMTLAPVAATGGATPVLARAKLNLRHPNHTGMVMDQQTLLYTLMKMVSDIRVQSGDDLILAVEGSIALSQDPVIEFDYPRGGHHEMTVTFKDTDGGAWTRTFQKGPQS